MYCIDFTAYMLRLIQSCCTFLSPGPAAPQKRGTTVAFRIRKGSLLQTGFCANFLQWEEQMPPKKGIQLKNQPEKPSRHKAKSKGQSRKISFSKVPAARTVENLANSIFCFFFSREKLTKRSQNLGLANEFSATPPGQLNRTGPIANSSDYSCVWNSRQCQKVRWHGLVI